MNKFKKYLAYITVFNVLIVAVFLGALGSGNGEIMISSLLILLAELPLGLFLLIPSATRPFGQALILSNIIGLIIGWGACSIMLSIGR